MTPDQVVAFNNGSGTTADEVLYFIRTVLVVIAFIWACIMLIGNFKSFLKEPNVLCSAISIIRIVAVVTLLLILVSV